MKNYIETKDSEKDYRELARLGSKLGVPIPECFLDIEVKMPNGEVVHQHSQRSHSWNRNFYNMLFCNMVCKNPSDATFGAGLLSFMRPSGAPRSYASLFCLFGYPNGGQLSMVDADATGGAGIGLRAGNGVDSFGILVGTDDTAEDFESGTLIAKVAQGNSAGQLAYQASELHAITYTSGTKTLSDVLSRYANNNSGGIITMKESAIYIAMGLYAGYTPEYIMTARDVLGAPVAIPDTGQLKVTYTINLVYPH